jgi:hypothetical protein
VRTKTLENAGANPKWSGEVHDFPLGEGANELRHGQQTKGNKNALRNAGAGRNLHVAVYDADGPYDKELIGSCNIGIDSIILTPNSVVDNWWHVAGGKSGKSHGQINLQIVWIPSMMPMQAGAAPMQQAFQAATATVPSAVPAAAAATGGATLGAPPAFAAPTPAAPAATHYQAALTATAPTMVGVAGAAAGAVAAPAQLPLATAPPPAANPAAMGLPPLQSDVRGWYYVRTPHHTIMSRGIVRSLMGRLSVADRSGGQHPRAVHCATNARLVFTLCTVGAGHGESASCGCSNL